jgi:predicted nucleotidyltransferase
MRKEDLMDKRVAALMKELKSGLQMLYGPRLKGIYLYGSYARNEADEESDVDVLIVLDRIESYRAEVERTGYLNAELSLRYGLSISRVFVSERDWREGETPFLANAREEAVAA